MISVLIDFTYLLASVLFIFGIKGLTHPRTAVRGNLLGATGMLLAVVATLGHLTMTQAFRHAEIAAIQPVSFIQLVWAALLGLYIFGEEPDMWTVIGGAVIVGSATYIAHREARLRRPS